MPRRLVALSVLALPLLATQAVASHKPDHPANGGNAPLTAGELDAKPNPIVFGSPTTLSGRLSGDSSGELRVRLEADDTLPYGDVYQPVITIAGTPAETTSDKNGRYAFDVTPARNTQYRAVTQSAPPVASAPRLVRVRPRVGVSVSDTTPRAGSRVRFRGSVTPALYGSRARIQRRSSTGQFVTVKRARLRDAGSVSSRYSRRVRIRRDGTYRVKVARHADHANGFSRVINIDAR